MNRRPSCPIPNAALTPRARLRLARLIVDQGWSPVEAAKMFMIAEKTARNWASRYRDKGETGMADRSSRPHHSPAKTSDQVVRRIVALRWRQRLGLVQIAGQLDIPASTVHAVPIRCRINRLTRIDRVTGEPLRRYEHDRPGSLIHVDVTKFGNIPDGGGHRFVGRQQGDKNKVPPPTCPPATIASHGPAKRSYTPSLTTTPASPTSRSTPTRRHPPRSVSYTARSPGSPTTMSPSNECSPTTAAATDPTRGATPEPNSASATHAPAPTGRKPTARSNDSTAPRPTAGPTPATTNQNTNAEQPYPAGSTSTITTDPTQPSEANHPSPD
jgi:homeodomain-containing protein